MVKQALKLVAVIAENLPEMDSGTMQSLIENPKELKAALRKAFGLNHEFKVFKTIKLGTAESNEELLSALEAGGVSINKWAKDMLNSPNCKVAARKKEVDLVVVTIADLGFGKGDSFISFYDIYHRAYALGLEPCPAEVGPQLRLQYKDQPMGECLFVAMEPIPIPDTRFYIFCVAHDDGGLVLDGESGRPGDGLNSASRAVFLLRKSA